MITTLLTHEFRRTRGILAVVLGGATLLVLGASLMVVTGWPVVDGLGMAIGMMALIGMIPVLGIALVVDYWRSAYGRHGYFTHSLPVKGSTIYAVRLLYGFLLSVVSVILVPVLAVPLALAAVWREVEAGADPVAYLRSVVAEVLAGIQPGLLSLVVLFVIVAVWGGLVTYYFAATVGSGPRLARLGLAGPIVVYVALYMVMQVLPFFGIVALPFGIGQVGDGLGVVSIDWWEATRTGREVQAMPLGFIPVYAVLGVVLIWWTARSWNRRVSLR